MFSGKSSIKLVMFGYAQLEFLDHKLSKMQILMISRSSLILRRHIGFLD